jgi:tRNA dimethylallyltransferase
MNTNNTPILIAGPTAAGKSALALRLAKMLNGVILNADAIQVYDCWQVLSARPTPAEMALVPHRLFGHIAKHQLYSTGHWLRELRGELQRANVAGQRPIIIGGTGLYFTALTQGLVEIPPIPDHIRTQGNARRIADGKNGFLAELLQNDPKTLAAIDANNPARLQRAWEVLQATGTGLVDWHSRTPPPLVNPDTAVKLVLNADRDWLADRIDRRFDIMMDQGALEEVAAYAADGWSPELPSAQAIGAQNLYAYLSGEADLATANTTAKAQSRQYAKRQRTWFRSKMKDWHTINPANPLPERELHKIATSFS